MRTGSYEPPDKHVSKTCLQDFVIRLKQQASKLGRRGKDVILPELWRCSNITPEKI